MNDPNLLQRLSITRKKWVLFVFALIGLISSVALLIISISAFRTEPYYYDYQNREHKRQAKIAIGVGVVSILFQFLGMLGAYQEKECLILFYGIMCFIIAFINIVPAVNDSSGNWFSLILYILIAIYAFSLVRDLRRLRLTPIQTTITSNDPNMIYTINPNMSQQNYHAQNNPHIMSFNPMPGQTYAYPPGQIYANTNAYPAQSQLNSNPTSYEQEQFPRSADTSYNEYYTHPKEQPGTSSPPPYQTIASNEAKHDSN